jgi:hypothetical protein
MRQVVLDLPQFFFADDDTLKSLTSFFLLREFGAAYNEAVFSEVCACRCRAHILHLTCAWTVPPAGCRTCCFPRKVIIVTQPMFNTSPPACLP